MISGGFCFCQLNPATPFGLAEFKILMGMNLPDNLLTWIVSFLSETVKINLPEIIRL